MRFEDGDDARAPAAAAHDGRPGLLSDRPWQLAAAVAPSRLESVRRDLPLSRAVTEPLLRLLAGRDFDDAGGLERFFYPRLDQLHDPLTLRGMPDAADRLLLAASRGEAVAVHGDFDVDGLTGAALLHELVSAVEVDGSRMRPQEAFVPDRTLDGYGVAGRMIEFWAEAGVTLLITVDTGSAAHAELGRARELGLEVVVLDHHLFTEAPPGLTALVNPRREDETYPNRELCGVGVAWKLAEAIRARAPEALPEQFLDGVLDLAALGLVADQMPLTGENRVLVQLGLKRISNRESLRPGLRALLEVAGLDAGFPVSATHVAYQLAPRLNACGRIGRVQTALELLLSRDPSRAKQLAREADETNSRRKLEDHRVEEEALRLAAPYAARGDAGLVLGSRTWHKGVIGISAARLVEAYDVPTILFSIEGEEARGSARSVNGVDVKAALDCCADLLVRYGGHAQAAGMTLPAKDLEALRERFCRALSELPGAGDVSPRLYDLDLPLQELAAAEISDFCQELTLLEPFGEGNPKPVFRCDGLRLSRLPAVIGQGKHLRLAFAGPARAVTPGPPALSREFISFGSAAAWTDMLRGLDGGAREALDLRWDVLFQINPNTWRPRNGAPVDPVQLQLLDIKRSAS